jgi:hypothetical protein
MNKALNGRFDAVGYTTHNLISNMHNTFLISIFVFLIIVIVKLAKMATIKMGGASLEIQDMVDRAYDTVMHGLLIRFVQFFYLEYLMLALLNCHRFKFEGGSEGFSCLMTIVFTAVLFPFPAVLGYFIYKNQNKLDVGEF